jgi:hypothetical protein
MRFIKWLLIVVRILVICLALYVLAIILWPNTWGPTFEPIEVNTITSMSNEPDEYEKQLMAIDDNLPHHVYRKISDSIKHIQNLEKMANHPSMDGWILGFAGFHQKKIKKNIFFDSTYQKHSIQSIPDTSYYIGLNGYYLKMDHSTFRKNDTTFLKYPVITKRDTLNKRISGHFETKPLLVDVNDLSDKIEVPYKEKRELLIRVSKNQYWSYMLIIAPIGILSLLFVLWGIILQSIRVLEDIANQEAFKKKTYKKLYIITISFWSIVLIQLMMSYALHFYFKSYIDQAFYLRFTDFFSNHLTNILGGFITFCLAYAFRKGYQLQQDQNLTI